MSLAEKINVLDKIRILPHSMSRRKLCEILGVAKTSLARLIQQEDELRLSWAEAGDQCAAATRKRKRQGKSPTVEEALKRWYLVVMTRDIKMTGPFLKNKANELAARLGDHEFKASDGWLSRWKVRHQINLKRSQYERQIAVDRSQGFDEKGEKLQPYNEVEDQFIINTILSEISKERLADEETTKRKAIERVELAERRGRDEPRPLLTPSVDLVTNDNAKKCIEELRRYFLQGENVNSSPLSALDICESFVNSHFVND